MKVFTTISLILASAVSAQAQLRTDNNSAAQGLRQARQEMEANTERTVLEKLEASRLEDERARRERFESLNFNVVQEPQNSTTTSF